MRSYTQAEWNARRERWKKIADAKQIAYSTLNEPNTEDCTMPIATCPHCKKDWAEEEYWEITNWNKQELVCRNCGMINKVIGHSYSLELTIQETGRFDSDTLAELEEDETTV